MAAFPCPLPALILSQNADPTLLMRLPRAVIATIGPASQDVDTLVRLLEAGVTCCRVDLTVRAAPMYSIIEIAADRAYALSLLCHDTGPVSNHLTVITSSAVPKPAGGDQDGTQTPCQLPGHS